MSNVVSLRAVRTVRKVQQEDLAYKRLIDRMSKLELLEEMVRFQEQRSTLGRLTLQMMVRGRYLFAALERSAETQELKLLTGSYHRHLDYELEEYLKDPEKAEAELAAQAAEEA